ncbi:MAG: hypothetical protein ACOVNY_07735 [Chitinophagaceae bacterium]
MVSIKNVFIVVCVFPLYLWSQKPKANNAAYVNEFKQGNLAMSNDTAWYIVNRKKDIATTLQSKLPIKLLTDNVSEKMLLAQQIALTDSNFTKYVFDRRTKKPLLNEIFGVYPARPGDVKKGTPFLAGTLARVEMYNFAYNLTTVAIVDYFSNRVLSVNNYPQTQPDLPKHLITLATNIAINASEVTKALGFKPNASEALMASTKTALNRTRCERSMHVCVAPTFVVGSRALWAVVDLTDCRIVGLRWTDVGKDAPEIVITERKLQNENIADCYCEKVNALQKNGWKLDYLLTSSDGLMISNVQYKNKRVVNNAKLVDWHVSYSGTDGFGYSDAVGCPIFSQAAVVATEPPKIAELVENDSIVGFVLEQKFYSEMWPGACNYSYAQRYFFYNDGRFRVSCASIGRGCGNNGTYRPVFRIAFAGSSQQFYEWNKEKWELWKQEKWQQQTATTIYNNDKYQYKLLLNDGSGFYIEPSRGQFNDGGRGDNAFAYVTKNHPDKDEGETDLITIGPCCNTDYKQGPEKFINQQPENIVNTDLVFWYVPQMKNDDTPGKQYCWAETYYEDGIYKIKTYPCFAGPLFVPIK